MILRAGYHWLLYIVVVAFFFKELDLGRSVIVLSALLGLIYLWLSRTALRAAKARSFQQGRGTVRSVIVGGSQLALDVRQALLKHPEIGFTLLGLVVHQSEAPDEEMRRQLEENGVRILGSTEEISTLVERHRVEEIFLAVAHMDPNEQFELLHTADIRGVSVHVVSDIFGVINEQAKVDEISAFPVITLRDGHLPLHQMAMKRTLDLACAIAGLTVWLLFFHWWIAWRIRAESAGPVFFRQDRVGRDGRRFTMLKYRTMITDAEPYAVAPTAEDDPRVTRFGRWLRKTSLDELPQLVNVLKGDMSMVGPRPEMPFIVEKYEPWQRRRLDVKPGVTGLWQVIGRKNLPLHLNMQYDFYYIKNQSFMLDIEILFRTVPAVLKGKGAF
jgi:exopolysaccharide biosynthesis polyprenyl glycosylphosphotransferase